MPRFSVCVCARDLGSEQQVVLIVCRLAHDLACNACLTSGWSLSFKSEHKDGGRDQLQEDKHKNALNLL